jgi:hypothetical protein
MKVIFGGHRASRRPVRQVTEGTVRARDPAIMTYLGMLQSERVA